MFLKSVHFCILQRVNRAFCMRRTLGERVPRRDLLLPAKSSVWWRWCWFWFGAVCYIFLVFPRSKFWSHVPVKCCSFNVSPTCTRGEGSSRTPEPSIFLPILWREHRTGSTSDQTPSSFCCPLFTTVVLETNTLKQYIKPPKKGVYSLLYCY